MRKLTLEGNDNEVAGVFSLLENSEHLVTFSCVPGLKPSWRKGFVAHTADDLVPSPQYLSACAPPLFMACSRLSPDIPHPTGSSLDPEGLGRTTEVVPPTWALSCQYDQPSSQSPPQSAHPLLIPAACLDHLFLGSRQVELRSPSSHDSGSRDYDDLDIHGSQSHHFMANRWETVETVTDCLFLGLQNHADGDCSHEIKRHLLLGRKTMTNLDSILKRRDITLPTKVCLVKAMVFSVVMYGCESWTIK